MDPSDIMLPVSMRLILNQLCKLMSLTEFNQWSQGEGPSVEEDEVCMFKEGVLHTCYTVLNIKKCTCVIK